MVKTRDPVDIVASIRGSIEVSLKGSRRVRGNTLRDLFGFDAWTVPRKERVTKLLEDQGVRAQPTVSEAGLHDWIVLSLPVLPKPDDSRPDPRPSLALPSRPAQAVTRSTPPICPDLTPNPRLSYDRREARQVPGRDRRPVHQLSDLWEKDLFLFSINRYIY